MKPEEIEEAIQRTQQRIETYQSKMNESQQELQLLYLVRAGAIVTDAEIEAIAARVSGKEQKDAAIMAAIELSRADVAVEEVDPAESIKPR